MCKQFRVKDTYVQVSIAGVKQEGKKKVHFIYFLQIYTDGQWSMWSVEKGFFSSTAQYRLNIHTVLRKRDDFGGTGIPPDASEKQTSTQTMTKLWQIKDTNKFHVSYFQAELWKYKSRSEKIVKSASQNAMHCIKSHVTLPVFLAFSKCLGVSLCVGKYHIIMNRMAARQERDISIHPSFTGEKKKYGVITQVD